MSIIIRLCRDDDLPELQRLYRQLQPADTTTLDEMARGFAEMLAVLEGRIRQADGEIAIEYLQSDVTALPFADGTFDLAVIVHLLYFIPEWRRAVEEITRVVRADGPLLLMNTGLGMEIPALNERYKALCAERGFERGYPGAAATPEILAYLAESGRTLETIRNRWQWVSHIPLRTALSYMERRAYSYTAMAPDAIHEKVMRQLTDECLTDYTDLDTEIDVPNQIYLTIVSRSSI